MSFDSLLDAVTATPFHWLFMSIANVMWDCLRAVKPKEPSAHGWAKAASSFYMFKMLDPVSGKLLSPKYLL